MWLNKNDAALLSETMLVGETDGDKRIYHEHFGCGHFHRSQPEPTLPIALNPQWWSLAHQHYASELASTCGCH